MAIKIKRKRPETAEAEDLLDQPDQILAATQDTFGWLQDNRNVVIGAIGGIAVLLIAGSLAFEVSRSSAVESAAPILRTIANANAPVGGETASFVSAEARAAAVLASDAKDEPVLGGVVGAALLQTGDASGATERFQAFVDHVGDGPEAIAVAFGLAAAQAEAGDLNAAVATLESVQSTSPALAALASAERARLVDAFGAPERALAVYREHIERYPSAPGLALMRDRVTQLEIELGVDPAPAAPQGDADDE